MVSCPQDMAVAAAGIYLGRRGPLVAASRGAGQTGDHTDPIPRAQDGVGSTTYKAFRGWTLHYP